MYTGRTLLLRVTNIMDRSMGLMKGWVVMSVQRVKIVPTDFLDSKGIE
jgi:hypothetical protein